MREKIYLEELWGLAKRLEIMDIDRSFWCDKRVVVTGHTGFKGAWLSIWLKSLGAEVYGFSLEMLRRVMFFIMPAEQQITCTLGTSGTSGLSKPS